MKAFTALLLFVVFSVSAFTCFYWDKLHTFVNVTSDDIDEQEEEEEVADLTQNCTDNYKPLTWREIRDIKVYLQNELKPSEQCPNETHSERRERHHLRRFQQFCPISLFDQYTLLHRCVSNEILGGQICQQYPLDKQTFVIVRCANHRCGGIGNLWRAINNWFLLALHNNWIFVHEPSPLYHFTYFFDQSVHGIQWLDDNGHFLEYVRRQFNYTALHVRSTDYRKRLLQLTDTQKLVIIDADAFDHVEAVFFRADKRIMDTYPSPYHLKGCLSVYLWFTQIRWEVLIGEAEYDLQLWNRYQQSIVIGIHIRFGDYSYMYLQMKKDKKMLEYYSSDRRITSDRQLIRQRRVIDDISAAIEKQSGQTPVIFLATDNSRHISTERKFFGDRLLNTAGVAYSTDQPMDAVSTPETESIVRRENLRKALLDVFLLTKSDIFIRQTSSYAVAAATMSLEPSYIV